MEPEVNRLAEELKEWSKRDDAITMFTYVAKKQINKSYWDDLLKKWPQLSQAWEFARGEIGQRREYYGLIGKFNSSLVSKTMNFFNPYYKDHFEWEAKLTKQDNSSSDRVVYVSVAPIPDVPEVKRLESKDEASR